MWWWILAWALLLIGGLVALGLASWSVVRRAFGLGRQLGASADQVSRLLQPLREPYRPAASVLSDPSGLPDPNSRRRSGRRHRRR